MWDDIGSAHETVELKTVIAVTKEQQAAIRDADDRQQKHMTGRCCHSMVRREIETSWYAEEGMVPPLSASSSSLPAFFEISILGRGPRVQSARRSRARNEVLDRFRICRHCGMVQRPTRGDDDVGQHQPRCRVLQSDGELARDAWEAERLPDAEVCDRIESGSSFQLWARPAMTTSRASLPL